MARSAAAAIGAATTSAPQSPPRRVALVLGLVDVSETGWSTSAKPAARSSPACELGRKGAVDISTLNYLG